MTDMLFTVILLVHMLDIAMLLQCGIILSLVYSTNAKISDACHGSFAKQTTNILKCPRDQPICITEVLYYQWHIGDIECPHTINRPVNSRCCSHDTSRCSWSANKDHVNKLQRKCDSTRLADGACELLSRSPQIAHWRCYIDNIDYSTSSSVRSIHYICGQGDCQRQIPPSTALIPQTISNVKPPTKSVTSTTSLFTSSSSTTTGHKNGTSQLSTAADDSNIIRVTSRMMSHPVPDQSAAGAIAGGIIGTILIFLLILAAVFYKRWVSRQKILSSGESGNDSSTSVQPKLNFISPEGSLGHNNSIRSVWTIDSFDSVDTGKSSVGFQVSRAGSVQRAQDGHEYACLVRNGSVFSNVSSGTVPLEANTRGGYDHVHGEPPELFLFRYNEYDHITLPEGHYESPRQHDIPSEPSSPTSADKKVIYDHLRRESINKGVPYDSKNYDLLERNWNE